MPDLIAKATNWVEYCRKSSEGDERQIRSIPDQQSAMVKLADQLGVVPLIKLDEERSAKVPHKRPKFSAMVKMIEEGQIDGILCWHVNRLFRNQLEYGIIAQYLVEGRLKCIRTPEREYLPTDNVAILAMEAGLATQYSLDLGRDVRRGLYEKTEEGWRPGCVPPGYLNVGQRINGEEIRVIGPDPDRWAHIRQVWDEALTGAFTVPELRRRLNQRGYRSRPTKKFPSGPMSRTVLYNLLHNPVYYGGFWYGGSLYVGNQAPMVTKIEFDRVQQILARHRKRQPKKHQFAYTGLIRCGVCGCQITAEKKSKHYKQSDVKVSYTYYHCTGRKGCPKDSVPESLVEENIQQTIASFALTPESARAWAENIIAKHVRSRTGSSTAEFNQNRTAVAKLKEQLDGIIGMRAREELTAEEFQERKNRLQTELTRLTLEIRESADNDDRVKESWQNAIDFASRAQTAFDSVNLTTRRAVAGLLSSNYVLTLGKLDIQVDPLLDVFRTFEPPKTSPQQVGRTIACSISPALRRRLDAIRTQIISGKLCFEKFRAPNENEIVADVRRVP